MKVSIVMPVSDKIDSFKMAIESVLEQTYKNIELILIDLTDSDKQAKLLREYQEKDDRIIVYKSKRKQSLIKCLNLGFSVATGEYWMKMSEKMVLKSDALERIMKIFQIRKDEALIYTSILLMGVNCVDEKMTSYYNHEMKNIYLYNPARVCFVYKRKVYKRIGKYKEKNIYDVNNDYLIRVKDAGISMYHLKAEVCYVLQNQDMIFKDKESFFNYRVKKCREALGSCEDLNIKNKILDRMIFQCNELKRYSDSLFFRIYWIWLNNPINQYCSKQNKALSNCKLTFDMLADSYDNESSLEEPRKCYMPVMEIIKQKVHDNIKLLDIGCGTGVMLQTVYNEYEKKANLFGVDLSHEMVKISRQNLCGKNVQIIHGTLETVELPINYFDITLCMHSFHHYPKPLRSLWHMAKVLHKNGVLIIADNRYTGWKRLERNLSLFINNYPYGDMWMYSFWELFLLTSLVGFHKQKYIKVGEKSFIFMCEKK